MNAQETEKRIAGGGGTRPAAEPPGPDRSPAVAPVAVAAGEAVEGLIAHHLADSRMVIFFRIVSGDIECIVSRGRGSGSTSLEALQDATASQRNVRDR